MDPNNQSSFIPKQPTRPIAPRRRTKRVAFPLFSMVGYAFFVGAIIAALGMFIYNQYTEKQFAQAVTDLDRQISDFNIVDFNTVMQFNQRIKEARTILNNHISVNNVLEVIQSLSVQSLSFTAVSLERESADTVLATIAGTGTEFDFLIFQRDLLASQTVGSVKNVTVEQVTYLPEATAGSEASPKQVQFSMQVQLAAAEFLTGIPPVTLPPAVDGGDEVTDFTE